MKECRRLHAKSATLNTYSVGPEESTSSSAKHCRDHEHEAATSSIPTPVSCWQHTGACDSGQHGNPEAKRHHKIAVISHLLETRSDIVNSLDASRTSWQTTAENQGSSEEVGKKSSRYASRLAFRLERTARVRLRPDNPTGPNKLPAQRLIADTSDVLAGNMKRTSTYVLCVNA